MALSDREREMLLFSALHYRWAGDRERDIEAKFGVTVTGYTTIINRLADREDALRELPLQTKRLQRLRAARQRSRSVRRLG